MPDKKRMDEIRKTLQISRRLSGVKTTGRKSRKKPLKSSLISLEDRALWIPLETCKNGWVYYIHARNGKVGIFEKKEKGFRISRHKFSSNFLFVEYHWDTGIPFGTVKPITELEKAPKFENDDEKLAWLNAKTESIKEDPWEKA